VRILVFNCGSSSLKYQLVELDDGGSSREVARGTIERIGEDASPGGTVDGGGESAPISRSVSNHREAVAQVLHRLAGASGTVSGLKVDATAHRIVHGGPRLFGPVVLDEAGEKAIEEASEFAPLHNPPALDAIRACREHLPDTPLVVLSDTAFYRDLPPHARTYALPRELTSRYGIRRYGFHGCGHGWMMERYAELTGTPSHSLNLVTLQLGAGCSATAIRAGKAVDTSMGLTPLEGLMMATRSGDLDPAISSYLSRHAGLDPAAIENLLNHSSGLLGVSGVSADIRDVRAAAASGNADAGLALEMFCYRIRKYLGQYLAIEGQTAAIIFGGGIGEHDDAVRAKVCNGLEHLGIVMDVTRNQAASGREYCFSAETSRIKLYVIPLNEELYIARAAMGLLKNRMDARGA